LERSQTSRCLIQDELEALSGIPKARISRYENNHVEPSLHSLSALAKGLGLSAARLVRMADL
jgi:transcriptional regulator with XRE-family HTH domain